MTDRIELMVEISVRKGAQSAYSIVLEELKAGIDPLILKATLEEAIKSLDVQILTKEKQLDKKWSN